MVKQGYLVWDFDGTLGQRKGGWTGALLQVIAHRLPEWQGGAEQIKPYLQSGFPWHAPECAHSDVSADDWWQDMEFIFYRAYHSIGLNAKLARQMSREVRSAYLDLSCWECFSDSIPALKKLARSGWQHVLLTNHVPELAQILDHLSLTNHFSQVFNSAQTGYEKPNPHAFRQVDQWIQAQGTGQDQDKVWLIGDSLSSDVRGAQEAGMKAILVRGSSPGVPSCLQLSEITQWVEK